MKTRPRILSFIAILLLGIAISLPVQVMVLFGHSPLEFEAVLAEFAPLNWVIMILAPATACLAWRASRATLFAAPGLLLVVALNNWLVASYNQQYTEDQAWLGTILLCSALGLIMAPGPLAVLLDPSKRWWLTPRRVRARLPIKLCLDSDEIDIQTFDISRGGAFLTGKVLSVGSEIRVQLAGIRCQARVVRSVERPRGEYPAGVGIQFIGTGPIENLRLALLMRQAEVSALN